MLTRTGRVQLAVQDRAAAAETFAKILNAVTVSDDIVAPLAARRRTVQAGKAFFELLEPSGDGPVQEFVSRRREGLFGAGFSTSSLQTLAKHFDSAGVTYTTAGNQLLLDPSQTRGMRCVISYDRTIEPSEGAIVQSLYEVTNLVDDWQATRDHYARIFDLDSSRFCPITSDEFGYSGVLTLYDPPAVLDRIEVVHPTDPTKAMGKFYAKNHQSLYMCFIEVRDIIKIAARLDAAGARYSADRGGGADSMFIHPSALHGMLVGVSRTSVGWSWSGRPDLVLAR